MKKTNLPGKELQKWNLDESVDFQIPKYSDNENDSRVPIYNLGRITLPSLQSLGPTLTV